MNDNFRQWLLRLLRIQRTGTYGSQTEALDEAIRLANSLGGLKPGQAPPDALYWIGRAFFKAPVAPIHPHLDFLRDAEARRDAFTEFLAGEAEVYSGRVAKGLNRAQNAISLAGTAHTRLAMFTNVAHTAIHHYQSYREELWGKKDPFLRSHVERLRGCVEALKAFASPCGDSRHRLLTRSADHLKRSWNLFILCGFPRWADPTWPAVDAVRALVYRDLYDSASAALDTMNTGIEMFLDAPYSFNINVALVELLLSLQVAGQNDFADLRESCRQVADAMDTIEGDESWKASFSGHRALVTAVAGRIEHKAALHKGALADALALYKEAFQSTSDLSVRVRVLRLIYQAIADGPVLAASAPAIAAYADALAIGKENSMGPAGLVADDDALWFWKA